MTRVVTFLALGCLLVAGVAAASILGRGSVPEARLQTASNVVKSPVSNRESKQDRLTAAASPSIAVEPPNSADMKTSLRQAFASSEPVAIGDPGADLEAAAAVVPPASAPPAAVPEVAAAAPTPLLPSRPKPASKPPVQKSYALLSDAQIAGIKERLRLSAAQEYYWPAVEDALRAVARKIHARRQSDPRATGVPIDPDAAEVQQLKSAAMPLLFQLREDQKQEVRTLARLIGLEKVAAQI